MPRPPFIDSCKSYHDATSYDRCRMAPHRLNWSDVPMQAKSYSGLTAMPLAGPQAFPKASLWDIVQHSSRLDKTVPVTIQSLSGVLLLGYGVTAAQRAGGQIHRLRSAPSAGALFPAEVYLAGSGLLDHPTGLDYFNPESFALIRLRDEEAYLPALTAMPYGAGRSRQAAFLLSGIFFRSAWKYRQRAFRYVMLDVGHLVENFVLSLGLFQIPREVYYDFNDGLFSRLMGLDTQREACFACVNWGEGRVQKDARPADRVAGIQSLSEKHRAASRTAAAEITYSEIADIYRISSQPSTSPVMCTTENRVTQNKPSNWYPVLKTDETNETEMPFAGAVLRRRSKRNFARTPLPLAKFMRLLELLCVETTVADTGGAAAAASCLTTGFLAGEVEGIDPGFYVLSNTKRAYGLVEPGNFLNKMAHGCLDQLWLKFASLHFLFMANLREIDEKIGARGYRYALMNAGRLGQRLYLGATALKIGCCGIGALYDEEARTMLSLNTESALLYLVAVGPLTTTGS
jgi:SagB-type dehydrogenase family enzyme